MEAYVNQSETAPDEYSTRLISLSLPKNPTEAAEWKFLELC